MNFLEHVAYDFLGNINRDLAPQISHSTHAIETQPHVFSHSTQLLSQFNIHCTLHAHQAQMPAPQMLSISTSSDTLVTSFARIDNYAMQATIVRSKSRGATALVILESTLDPPNCLLQLISQCEETYYIILNANRKRKKEKKDLSHRHSNMKKCALRFEMFCARDEQYERSNVEPQLSSQFGYIATLSS